MKKYGLDMRACRDRGIPKPLGFVLSKNAVIASITSLTCLAWPQRNLAQEAANPRKKAPLTTPAHPLVDENIIRRLIKKVESFNGWENVPHHARNGPPVFRIMGHRRPRLGSESPTLGKPAGAGNRQKSPHRDLQLLARPDRHFLGDRANRHSLSGCIIIVLEKHVTASEPSDDDRDAASCQHSSPLRPRDIRLAA
jgi:hypothetical protein